MLQQYAPYLNALCLVYHILRLVNFTLKINKKWLKYYVNDMLQEFSSACFPLKRGNSVYKMHDVGMHVNKTINIEIRKHNLETFVY